MANYNPIIPNYGYGNLLGGMNNPAQMPIQASAQQIIQVHGEDGAKAFALAPNSSVLMMDETDAIVWAKVTDGAGYATLKGFRITPIETKVADNTQHEYASKDDVKEVSDQIKSLKERFDKLAKELGND